MKPGRRRLLIPGLLIALLIVVVLAAAIRQADAATTPTPVPVIATTEVASIDDPRITESSGLAASEAHPGIAYTINDSGHAARVYAIEIATGEVVGVTTVRNVRWRDTEAMALSKGTLWISDAGNNRDSRDDFAVYAMKEPGRGDHVAGAIRHPVRFSVGPINIEAMAVVNGRIELYNKGWPNGAGFVLPPKLATGAPNVAQVTGHVAPAFATDAGTTPDGRYVLVRTPASVEVRDATTWRLLRADAIPPHERGETLTVESSGRSYLIGNEGSGSKLRRVGLSPASFKADAAPIDVVTQLRAAHPVRSAVWRHRNALAVAAGAVVLASGVAFYRWRRSSRRGGG